MSDRDILRAFGYDPDNPVPRDEDDELLTPDPLLSSLAGVPGVDEIPRQSSWATHPDMSASEVEVLRCLSHGMTYQMAADTLGRGFETVKEQVRAARYKLHARTAAHACCEAIRRGLIP